MEFILTFALLCFTGSLKKILTRQITRKEAEHSVSRWLIGDGRKPFCEVTYWRAQWVSLKIFLIFKWKYNL